MSVWADLGSGHQHLPRRVFAPLADSGLSVCDYIFPEENTADVAERLKEMLGCELSEGDVDTSMEAQSNFIYFFIMHDVFFPLAHWRSYNYFISNLLLPFGLWHASPGNMCVYI